MGTRWPETCWATYKEQLIRRNKYNTKWHLVGFLFHIKPNTLHCPSAEESSKASPTPPTVSTSLGSATLTRYFHFSFSFTQFCFCAQNILRPTMPAAPCDHICSLMSQSDLRLIQCVKCQECRRRRCTAQNNDPLAVGQNPIYTRNWFNSFTNKYVGCNCVSIVPAVLQHFNHKMYHHRVEYCNIACMVG